MRIAICASMAFSEKAVEAIAELRRLGHEARFSSFTEKYLGKSEAEKEALTLKHKNECDAIRDHYETIKASDAILVLNYDRKGVAHYIGGNTLMEIGFAHVLNKRIFLLNPIPDIPFYRSEIEACRPVILHGDLKKIR